MVKKIVALAGLSITLVLASSPILANEHSDANTYESYEIPFFGVGGGYSNVGGGVDMTIRLSPRIGFNYSFYKQNETISVGNDLSVGVDILNRGFSFDYFPTGNNFHITLGVQIPDNKADFSIDSPHNIHPDINSISGNIKLGSGFSPYLGVGYKQNNKRGLGYFIEGGASYLKPVLSVSYESSQSNSTTDSAFNNFKNEIQSEIDGYRFNPMIKLGIFYIF